MNFFYKKIQVVNERNTNVFKSRGCPDLLMVLVQWEGLPLEDASWEDWQQLKELYNLEDKVLSEERGDVMNEEDKALGEDEGATQERSRRMKKMPKHWDVYQMG